MPKKLLLVEDSATIQKVFELAFEKSDVSVITVNNGDDAIRMLGKVTPNLVIVDVTLPEKDGFEVATLLAAEESMKGIPVLLLSGAFVTLDEKKLKACGAKGVLLKPFEVSELMDKVGGFLNKEEEELPAKTSQPDSLLPDDERWDFSDVLEEVGGKPQAAKPETVVRPAKKGPEVLLQAAEKDEEVDLDEFDVSADDIEAPGVPLVTKEGLLTMEEAAFAGAYALEEVEEFEEIGELEDGVNTVLLAEASSEEKMFEEQYAPLPSDIPLEPDMSVLEEILEKTSAEIPEKPIEETVAASPVAVLEKIIEKTPAEIPEKPIEETVAVSPAAVPEKILEKTPAEMPEKTSEKTVAASPVAVPEKVLEKTPAEIPEKPIEETVAISPVAVPEKVLEKTPAEMPEETFEETDAVDPVAVLEKIIEETPAEIPEEAFEETAAVSPVAVLEKIIEETPAEIPEETFEETAAASYVDAPEDILRAELKEQFASRADAIFREVMEKAVEKAMLEMTERLTAELSVKIRESVEGIAWEVIPATAEALIREEIARIRAQAVKSTPS